MLQIGKAAPQFSLPDADMETVSLASFKGRKNVVLYFYAKDGTPGCTLQAIEFSDHEEHFAKQDCVVIGGSRDDCITHAEVRDENGPSGAPLAAARGGGRRARASSPVTGSRSSSSPRMLSATTTSSCCGSRTTAASPKRWKSGCA